MISSILYMLAQATAPTPELTNQAQVDKFSVVQLWSDDSDEFLEIWNQPTPPKLIVTTTIERNKPITAFVIFAGCKGDVQGNCNIDGDFTIFGPDGKLYDEHKDIDFWEGPAIEGFNLRLSPISPALIIEDGEELGKYKVRMSFTDRNANITAVTEQTLTIVESTAP